ncbi:MAG: hypothetical protein IH924_00760, partial [Proteobacteria bacterium]|nr:hypothetical protein [Pseudomonadota bacterium]
MSASIADPSMALQIAAGAPPGKGFLPGTGFLPGGDVCARTRRGLAGSAARFMIREAENLPGEEILKRFSAVAALCLPLFACAGAEPEWPGSGIP